MEKLTKKQMSNLLGGYNIPDDSISNPYPDRLQDPLRDTFNPDTEPTQSQG